MNKLKLLCWILVVLAAVWLGFWLVVDNPQVITVRLLGFEVESLPTGLWFLLVFSTGCLIGLLCGWPQLIRLKKQLSSLNRRLMKAGQLPH